ncbi:MAG: DUF58 domain-containing protein, partial [Pyrinomonadaceae bacterium]|nr:DUF58 domain-containing protein [Pyrinomonadaceae bacterium]
MSKIQLLFQLLSPKDIIKGFISFLVVLGGLVLSLLTLYAHRTGNIQLAGYSAVASLGFVVLIIVFVVPPLARNASREASQMDIPIEFTTGGAVFIGLLVIVGFAAWNTGNNLLFVVLSFLLSGIIVSFLIGYFCLKKLEIKLRFPEAIFAGEPTPVKIILINKKIVFPTFSVVAEIRGKQREKSIIAEELNKFLPSFVVKKIRPPLLKYTLDYFMNIPRRQTIENQTEHIFQNRGRFIVKDFELSTKFPFGFLRHRKRLPAKEAEIIIFPKIEQINEEISDLPLEFGNLTANKRGSGQDLLTLRDYQQNDDLRFIDWKATARSRRLTVREFAAEDEKRITVIFDTVFPKLNDSISLRDKLNAEQRGELIGETSIKFEQSVSQVASILHFFSEDRAEVRLIIDNDFGDFGFGKNHLHEDLRRLALL